MTELLVAGDRVGEQAPDLAQLLCREKAVLVGRGRRGRRDRALALGDRSSAGEQLLDAANIPAAPPKGGSDPGLLRMAMAKDAASKFIAAVAKHRHFERQADPPPV